jgi:ABC-type bacteriocin/lantibiotic exporter with double-glycine peptidase domain
VSKIINFSQVDAQRLTYFSIQVASVFFTPLKIIIALEMLAFFIGVSFLVGLAIMIVLMLFTVVFSKISAKVNDELLKAKDSRMKIAEEILQIVKFIKTNALEKYFFAKINKKR